MQLLKNLNFDTLKDNIKDFTIDPNSSYIKSYPEFIEFFKSKDKITEHDLIISSHFVYGWMPTIINLKLDNTNHVLELLNQAKKGRLLKKAELETLKKAINNSMVGASKLLHFINPKIYAIWDSRIYRYLTEKKSAYGIGKVDLYLEYLGGLEKIAYTTGFGEIQNKISNTVGYQISANRAIELVMFEAGKKVG